MTWAQITFYKFCRYVPECIRFGFCYLLINNVLCSLILNQNDHISWFPLYQNKTNIQSNKQTTNEYTKNKQETKQKTNKQTNIILTWQRSLIKINKQQTNTQRNKQETKQKTNKQTNIILTWQRSLITINKQINKQTNKQTTKWRRKIEKFELDGKTSLSLLQLWSFIEDAHVLEIQGGGSCYFFKIMAQSPWC